MATTYAISLLGQRIDTSEAPNPLVLAIFPQWNGEPTEGDPERNRVLVTFAEPQTPTDLGPLVKVEVVAA